MFNILLVSKDNNYYEVPHPTSGDEDPTLLGAILLALIYLAVVFGALLLLLRIFVREDPT